MFQLSGDSIIKVLFRLKDAQPVCWQQRSIERLRQGLRYLRRLLAVERPPEALALIPIRAAARPHGTRQRQQRTWRDQELGRTPRDF